MIIYTLSRHIDEGLRTDCFRTKREAHKFRTKVQRETRGDIYYDKDLKIRKWVIKNKDDLVYFGNIIGW